MRAGLSTIQQTLTVEAASVVRQAIGEAGRRSHGQTTPLHVAAALLGSAGGYLRQACIKSHPNSSHPLQCRALELCFSVALERLPASSQSSQVLEPPISNALMAALKRAQAHQRRGCPEQQQQPLLAVKVELEQLIISILDDPSVSRVMREASFSSPAVKATIEQSLTATTTTPAGLGLGGFRPQIPIRSSYLNPRLQQGGGGEEVRRVMDIFLRTKKRNPVLVGDTEPEAVIKEVLARVNNKELGLVEVIHAQFTTDRTQIAAKIKELGFLLDVKIGNLAGGGIILDLGDLKWLVHEATEAGRPVVGEMGKLLARFREREAAGGGTGRLWLTGTATCETYLRCQVYYSSLETDWDLQAVSIAPKAPIFPRLGGNRIVSSSSVDGVSPFTCVPGRRVSENLDPAQTATCCAKCTQSYEQELASYKTSPQVTRESPVRPSLPQWMQKARPLDGTDQTTDQDQELVWKQRSEELKKKWTEICSKQHNFGSDRIASAALSATSFYNSNLLGRQPFQPKFQLNKSLGNALKLNPNVVPAPSQLSIGAAAPQLGSPVRTELVLGNTEAKPHTKDFLGCISSEPENRTHEMQSNNPVGAFDTDSFKKLLKGLVDKVWWQREAASTVAATVTNCKMGNGKQRGGVSKGDMWLLFMGPDRVGKKKMATALADMVRGASPITISLGSRRGDRESGLSFRGKTLLDRIGDAIRRNPFSVIMLEDIDEADTLLRGSIKRAVERGRLADSNGREISLANVMFILTASCLPDNRRFLSNGVSLDEEKLASLAGGNWQLKLCVCEKAGKRRPNWVQDGDRATKPRKEAGSGFSFDLNEAAAGDGDGDGEEERANGSRNSSDLTVDHEDDHSLVDIRQSAAKELMSCVDDSIVFKPVDLGPLRRDIANTITNKFRAVMGEEQRVGIEVEQEAIERIASGVWLGRTGVEEWTEKVLFPTFDQLRPNIPRNEPIVVRLEPDCESDSLRYGEWLPSKVKVVADHTTTTTYRERDVNI